MSRNAIKRRKAPMGVVRRRSWLLWVAFLAVATWGMAATSISSRVHLIMGYTTLPSGSTVLEPFLATNAAWFFAFCIGTWWLLLTHLVFRRDARIAGRAICALATANLPLLAWLFRLIRPESEAGYWEPLWLSAWSGISFAILGAGLPIRNGHRQHWKSSFGLVCLLVLWMAAWWYSQTCAYYRDFFLGYNDFGHFAQRIVNTASGRGFLLESPILPTFWDHFNPGLLLLVPLWKLAPTVHLFFVIQALSLAAGAIFIWSIAARLRYGSQNAALLAAAWLAQPAVGQMNIAYTYGWHPVTMAIPLLLAAALALIANRQWLALSMAVVAMSMEEGVIVIVCLFCASCALQGWWLREGEEPASVLGLSASAWTLGALSSAVGFVLVYRLSGIAEFQTGRFVALGNSASEIILSPVLRPSHFWGQIFRWEKLAFCLCLLLPCYAISLARGWRWWLAAVPPLLVLIVWDHKPATSLAFQYSSCLLPLFWLATLFGSARNPSAAAFGSLTTGLILSLFVGQLPYSSPTLLDVVGRTYGADAELRRRAADEDGQWLNEQVQRVRLDGAKVLATGRIAAHLVGNRDIETVGQYLQRREHLARLPDRLGAPIEHYRWILLDRQEGFQQTPDEIASVEAEAMNAGFSVVTQRYDIVVLTRPQNNSTSFNIHVRP